jgi:hypothetical protein
MMGKFGDRELFQILKPIAELEQRNPIFFHSKVPPNGYAT